MDPSMYIGCGCVIVDADGRYLLVQETKAIARGRMALPAGKLEPGETLEQAACREALEETGLQVDIVGLLGVYHCAMTSEGSFGVNFVYEARVVGGQRTVSAEHPVVEWFSADEIIALDEAAQIRGSHVRISIERQQRGERLDPAIVTLVDANPLS